MKSEIADLVSTRLATPDSSAPPATVRRRQSRRSAFTARSPSTMARKALDPRSRIPGPTGIACRSRPSCWDRLGPTWPFRGRGSQQGTALDWLIDGAAWTVFLAGAAVRLWATLWIAGRKKQTVVDDGPYRACRNPLYVGSFVMGIGLGLFLKSLVFAAGLGLVMSLYLWFVVPAEERYMGAVSATAFDDYCRRVPRWIPQHRPAAPKRDFPAGRRPRGTRPRMRKNGLLDVAGGHGRTDVSPPRDGLADLVGRRDFGAKTLLRRGPVARLN